MKALDYVLQQQKVDGANSANNWSNSYPQIM